MVARPCQRTPESGFRTRYSCGYQLNIFQIILINFLQIPLGSFFGFHPQQNPEETLFGSLGRSSGARSHRIINLQKYFMIFFCLHQCVKTFYFYALVLIRLGSVPDLWIRPAFSTIRGQRQQSESSHICIFKMGQMN